MDQIQSVRFQHCKCKMRTANRQSLSATYTVDVVDHLFALITSKCRIMKHFTLRVVEKYITMRSAGALDIYIKFSMTIKQECLQFSHVFTMYRTTAWMLVTVCYVNCCPKGLARHALRRHLLQSWPACCKPAEST